MGQIIAAGSIADEAVELVGAIESTGHPRLGEDVGTVCVGGPVGVLISSVLDPLPDCVIDFSVPESALAIARQCAERQIPILVATTGFSSQQREELVSFSKKTAMLIAANCSLVVNLLMKLSETAAAALRDRDFDVEIIERHHRFKADAPSGTALTFAELIESQMMQTKRVFGREGVPGPRTPGEIGLHAIRGGDNVGEHTILFSTLGESMELVHKGHNRQSYATGALAAAGYLAGKPPGLYQMSDVLGLP